MRDGSRRDFRAANTSEPSLSAPSRAEDSSPAKSPPGAQVESHGETARARGRRCLKRRAHLPARSIFGRLYYSVDLYSDMSRKNCFKRSHLIFKTNTYIILWSHNNKRSRALTYGLVCQSRKLKLIGSIFHFLLTHSLSLYSPVKTVLFTGGQSQCVAVTGCESDVMRVRGACATRANPAPPAPLRR